MAGKFTALPARVEEMYEPQVNAKTAATAVSVTR